MTIEFTGRQTEITPAVRSYAERKLRKLAKVLHGITHVHVILTSDKHRQIAEVTVQSPHLTLAATEETADLLVSLGTVVEKISRQAQRHLGKLRQRKRRGVARPEAVWSGVMAAAAPPATGGPRIIHSRRFVARPMTVDEAVLEVGSSDDGLLVFRDAATEKVHVLFRRKDGNLGLIEPEI